METMNKLEDIVQIALEGGRRSDIEWAVRLAYNKALDDALELYYNPTSEEDQDTFDKDLESLKI
jgi:hypothetical protein